MADENEKGQWHCLRCNYEGPEEEFKRHPDYRSCPKCRAEYVYSLEIGPVWSCSECGYEGAEIEFDDGLKCHICSKCGSEDVFLDCDWQRLVGAENKTEKPKQDCEFDD